MSQTCGFPNYDYFGISLQPDLSCTGKKLLENAKLAYKISLLLFKAEKVK